MQASSGKHRLRATLPQAPTFLRSDPHGSHRRRLPRADPCLLAAPLAASAVAACACPWRRSGRGGAGWCSPRRPRLATTWCRWMPRHWGSRVRSSRSCATSTSASRRPPCSPPRLRLRFRPQQALVISIVGRASSAAAAGGSSSCECTLHGKGECALNESDDGRAQQLSMQNERAVHDVLASWGGRSDVATSLWQDAYHASLSRLW